MQKTVCRSCYIYICFAHISVITAVVTGSFVGAILIQVSSHAHFILDGHCGIEDWEIILIDKGLNKQ